MTKSEFGKLLKAMLEKDPEVVELARWAYGIFNENSRQIDTELKTTLFDLARMEDAPEFEFTRDELASLADDLVSSDD
jgi:hypothetical protein